MNSLEKPRNLSEESTVIDELKKAIDLIMNSTFFTFEKITYKQISGLPMGSPLAPILSHIVMVDREETCIEKLNFRPALYKRYVDDIIIALPCDRINETLNTFNSYHHKLQFTIETEIENTISFLNIALTREDNQYTTNWYRKPTWSGRFIKFFSCHPMPKKIGVIYMLVDRALKFSHPKHHNENLQLIRNTLHLNCYPMRFINRYVNRRRRTIQTLGNCHNCRIEFDTKRIVNLPYVEQIHQPLQRLLRPYDINLINNNKHNIHTITSSVKDRIPPSLRSNIVYRIPCNDCPSTYIGQKKDI